jgi:hypothetical protein
MKSNDPAYWMLEQGRKDPSKRSVQTAPYRESCYICNDEEFALIGLPLCYACPKCGGHVPADDTVCSDCGVDCHEEQERLAAEETATIAAA